MKEAEIFFVAESIRHGRKLPLGEMIMFLEGMAASLGEGHPLHSYLVAECQRFGAGDAQLELIASGQLKLNLPDQPRS